MIRDGPGPNVLDERLYTETKIVSRKELKEGTCQFSSL